MCVTREQPQLYYTRNIKIVEYTFEKVQCFKYLGTEVNRHNNNHEEIKKRVQGIDVYIHLNSSGQSYCQRNRK